MATGTITTTLTKASMAAAGVEGVPYLHGTPVETYDTTGLSSTIAATITTTVPTVVIAVINTWNYASSGAVRTVSGVSGGGLTWAKRSSKSQANGTSFSLNQEIWWANATGALTSQTITATLSAAASQQQDMMVFAVAGSPNPASPWDANVSLPATAGYANAVTPSSMTKSATQTSTKSMVLAFDAYAWNGVGNSTKPTDFIDILAPTIGTSHNYFWDYKPVSASGAISATWGNTQEFWVVTLDALTGDRPPPTGTISTTLTKASISAAAKETFTGTVSTVLTKASQLAAGLVTSGRMTTTLTRVSQSASGAEIFTGTVSTALTKASLSAAGWASAKGTIATNLTKISQVLSGADIATAGTITTRLAKASQTVSATEKFIANTVTTSLRKPSQAGAGWTTVHGTAVSNIDVGAGITIHASVLEVFTGTITTNIDVGAGISIDARTYEIFTGAITTHLSRANFAAVAEEDFIGHAVTRLGSSSGYMVATVVQALEIIEGPVVTVLPPFRPLILGAMLGQPGGGSWFSWRYTDA